MTAKLAICLSLYTLVFVLIGCKSKTEISAEQGHAVGQYNFGKMYATGDGVPENKIYAYMWVSLAAAQGLGDNAIKYKDEIAKQMTPSQIEEAERLSIECKGKGYKDCS
jgi:TPR repeat protein